MNNSFRNLAADTRSFPIGSLFRRLPGRALFVFMAGGWLTCALARASVETIIDHNDNTDATAAFQFKRVPRPLKGDAAALAEFKLIEGEADPNSGKLEKLRDGKTSAEDDQPAECFFFRAGTPGGRLLVDLRSPIEIKRISTYSWHTDSRAPQVYRVYGAQGAESGFDAAPKRSVKPESCGWTPIANVDTRPKGGDVGGQYGVNIIDSGGMIGKYRYLLFDIEVTEDRNPFGNTFYTEFDVIDRNAPEILEEAPAVAEAGKKSIEFDDGRYHFRLDTSETPELREWAENALTPAVKEWYPKIVKMLPSEGYEAPKTFTISFSTNMSGVAATGGTRIRCAAKWFGQNLKGEGVGAVVHELVHVVQQYGMARRVNPNATRSPGWLVEGIPDYIRWYLYEPDSHGAEITTRNLSRAKYDGSYRITANFLNWIVEKYDPKIIEHLNAAMREGKYEEALWQKFAGKSLQDLGAEWKAAHEKRLTGEVKS